MSTLERLQDLLVNNYGLPRARLVPEAELEALGVDSLALIEIVFEVEDEFGIKVDGDAAKFRTLGDVVKHVDRLLLEQQGAVPSAAA
jgi:acyl carrier protein